MPSAFNTGDGLAVTPERGRDLEELLERASAFDFPTDDPLSPVRVELRRGPFSPAGREWAITWRGRCWGLSRGWEWEPTPSNRDDAFLDRCRWSRDQALEHAEVLARDMRGGF